MGVDIFWISRRALTEDFQLAGPEAFSESGSRPR
jgi:hypothetical protein